MKINKKWWWIAILVVLIGILILFYIVNNKQAGVENKKISRDGYYAGDYISFEYPLNFKLEKINTTDGRVLENWKLTENSDNPTVITINLMASNKELGDFEAVQDRRNDKTQFMEEVGRMRELRGILFRTIDKKERTVYFSNTRRILTVDYIAKTNDLVKETEYQSLLDGISWE